MFSSQSTYARCQIREQGVEVSFDNHEIDVVRRNQIAIHVWLESWTGFFDPYGVSLLVKRGWRKNICITLIKYI